MTINCRSIGANEQWLGAQKAAVSSTSHQPTFDCSILLCIL